MLAENLTGPESTQRPATGLGTPGGIFFLILLLEMEDLPKGGQSLSMASQVKERWEGSSLLACRLLPGC